MEGRSKMLGVGLVLTFENVDIVLRNIFMVVWKERDRESGGGSSEKRKGGERGEGREEGWGGERVGRELEERKALWGREEERKGDGRETYFVILSNKSSLA